MTKAECTKADHIFYGILCVALACVAIAHLIEACRSRPKVEMIVLGVPTGKDKKDGVKQPAAGTPYEKITEQR